LEYEIGNPVTALSMNRPGERPHWVIRFGLQLACYGYFSRRSRRSTTDRVDQIATLIDVR
jgi:hypothetical protein